MVRVLIVIGSMNLGGAENFIMNIYRNLDTKKIQFDFIVHDKGTFDEEILEKGGKIYELKYITKVGPVKYKKELEDFFEKHKEYKIIHSHVNQVSGIILEVAKKYNIPVRIAHSHSTSNLNPWYIKLYKKYLQFKINKNATYRMACSEEAGKWLYNRKDFEVINNGIELKRFIYNSNTREEIREKLEIQENDIVLGHVGRFSTVKNHTYLIEIVKKAYQMNKNIKLLLVGDGILREEIQNKIKKYNLQDRVIITGNVIDTSIYYQAMDIFIFPSLHEGMPLTLIEAQANGLPIIASDNINYKIDITNTIKFMDIKRKPKEWALEVLKIKIKRKDNVNSIKEKGYDIVDTANYLQNFYLESVKSK